MDGFASFSFYYRPWLRAGFNGNPDVGYWCGCSSDQDRSKLLKLGYSLRQLKGKSRHKLSQLLARAQWRKKYAAPLSVPKVVVSSTQAPMPTCVVRARSRCSPDRLQRRWLLEQKSYL